VYNDDDFLQLSALQHFVFCPRQCALIHIEQVWDENIFTAEGKVMHNAAHEERFEMREGIRIERGMPLRSDELGINGKADVIEFHKTGDGSWLPFPIEYKRGKPKQNNCDKVQLCAQALCLEEMLQTTLSRGAVFYGKTRRRLDVVFEDALRQETKQAALLLHEFVRQGKTPKPVYSKKCESCSLIVECMPRAIQSGSSVKEYVHKMLEAEPAGSCENI